MQRTLLLLFIIYTLFSFEGFCQNLNLIINGKTNEETKIIDSLQYNKIHTDFNSIKNEVNTIQNQLFKLGYIENEIKQTKKINDSSFLSKVLLKRKFNTITISYNKNDIDLSTLELVSKDVFENNFKLDFSKTENALNIINSEISKKGFPFSKLKLSNITIEGSNLRASLIIDSYKEKRKINDIIIKGYEKFPRSYLKHFLKIKTNQVFDLDVIKSKTEALNNLNFTNQIKSPEVLFTKDSTTLYLYLNKANSNTFDGFLGFGTNEDTNKIELDGYLNLNLTNNLNFGESFRLLYKSDEIDQQTFEVDVSLPYLFNTPIGADLLLRIFKKDTTFTTVNQSARLHYQINSNHKVYGGIISTESNNLLSEANITSIISDYKTQYLTLAYQFLKPQSNNFLFPIKSKLYFETGFGTRESASSNEKQSQYTIDALKIFTLNKKNSLYIRMNGSSLISDTYFENELVRFGGINSIRGFEENSLFASLFGTINTEYRFQVNNSIYIHSIFDAGYFENKIISTKEKLFGYGFGFGILTKSGLLRFNYANGKNENTKFKLSNSKIHLSLVANF